VRRPPGSQPPPAPGGAVDARIGRAQQGATAVVLLAGFVFHLDLLVPVWTLVLLVDLVAGPRSGPVGRLFHLVGGRRLSPPRRVHPASRVRSNALPEVVILLVASLIQVLGIGLLSWIVTLAVAAAAAYSAATDTCVGCEITGWTRRHR
jgi:hypothetical protein